MLDEVGAAIHELQGGDEGRAQQAFASLAYLAGRRPRECARQLADALSEEQAGERGLATPRLLTLLGMTRQAVPQCLPLCLDVLRGRLTTEPPVPSDAILGAAAIVVRTQPRALLPDLAGSPAAADVDREIFRAIPRLLAFSSIFLRELPDSAVADMVRWLWCDGATVDLMMVIDLACLYLEQSDGDDRIVGLMVDLVERVPATDDEKRYAGQRLCEAGIASETEERLKAAWRAIRVAPVADRQDTGAPVTTDPDAPATEPEIDEWLAAFTEGDDDEVELARAFLDDMFERRPPPGALAWWAAVTVDSLPPRRRRTDAGWVLVQIATTVRRDRRSVTALPPPTLLCRWLDTPELLDSMGTQIALDLLSRQQPNVVVRRYLHRAVTVSGQRHAELLVGALWRVLTAAEPAAVLLVASRWVAFGFDADDFVTLLVDVLLDWARQSPSMIDVLARSLVMTTETSPTIEVAHRLLDELRAAPPEN